MFYRGIWTTRPSYNSPKDNSPPYWTTRPPRNRTTRPPVGQLAPLCYSIISGVYIVLFAFISIELGVNLPPVLNIICLVFFYYFFNQFVRQIDLRFCIVSDIV